MEKRLTLSWKKTNSRRKIIKTVGQQYREQKHKKMAKRKGELLIPSSRGHWSSTQLADDDAVVDIGKEGEGGDRDVNMQ